MIQEFFELLEENYFILWYLLALGLAIIHYKKYFDSALKFFPMIIAYTFFNELLGHFIRFSDNFALFANRTADNDIILNIYSVVFFNYFYFVYWKVISNINYRIVVKYLAISVLFAHILSCFYQNPLVLPLFYAISYASVILVICVILYFLDLTTTRKFSWALEKRNLMFWVSIGLGVFYFFFPIIYLTGYMDFDTWQKYNFRTILKILIILMYSIFSIGFVKSTRRAFRWLQLFKWPKNWALPLIPLGYSNNNFTLEAI